MTIKTAMVLAAGFGKRMRPITETIPKPLVPILGVPMLESIIAKLRTAGIQKIVVNAFYLKEQIQGFVDAYDDPMIILSDESEILETGGGVTQALPLLGNDPFVVVNGDVCWLDGTEAAIERVVKSWNPDGMDALLLVHPKSKAYGYEGAGDFFLENDQKLSRRGDATAAPYVYAGIQILHPKLFINAPKGAFSLNEIFDKALASDRLYGLEHDGEWFHVGTPEGLREVEGLLQSMLPVASKSCGA
ncbi:mannose-1-phosphate guanylyltransferase [Kiloniella spongiae]|uniref:Mannose-1-phosphate guanylyltransferase n=1 Tax=Kiloniella spongiae TaxID=1489064 RepID=A0A0H2MJJ1_9PROT|nr:nucleotidyltransferase family protein [Kiloniella spongiae]KLN62588.1 mannose-1-phosphate guanylyltransferase [Kiloniella spongiae]